MSDTQVNGSFFDITNIRLKTTSQLNLFNIYQTSYDKTKYMNIFRTYAINNDIINNVMYYYVYDVSDNDWLENISFKYYKSIDFWWVLAIMNNIINPFEELEEGSQLKVLKQQFLYQVIKDIDSISRL